MLWGLKVKILPFAQVKKDGGKFKCLYLKKTTWYQRNEGRAPWWLDKISQITSSRKVPHGRNATEPGVIHWLHDNGFLDYHWGNNCFRNKIKVHYFLIINQYSVMCFFKRLIIKNWSFSHKRIDTDMANNQLGPKQM